MTSTSSSDSDGVAQARAGGAGGAGAAASTIGAVLREAAAHLTEAGSESPRLDAELLLGHVLRVDRATLLASPESPLSAGQRATFDELVTRRATGEPVAYIRGLKEFYGLVLGADARALIPRPETETLVELALARISARLTSAPRETDEPLHAWDVGTGSGAIVIALAVEARRRGYARYVRFTATDLSADALALATENAVAHGVADAIDFAIADLASDVLPHADVLLANLPYIPSDVVPTLPSAASFEPVAALDGGDDGLRLIGRLLDQLPQALADGGVALLEIGSDQADPLAELVGEMPGGWSVAVHRDLGGRPRVAELSRGAAT